jgi:hypothetical protein
MVKAINEAPQGFKGPNYEKLRTVLLQKERSLIHDILKPVRSSWTSSGVSIVSDGWTDTKRRPLINVIASSPKGAMFLRAEDCSGEVKDNKFIADILISAIEQVGPANVVQVITDNAPVCKAAGLIVESRYNHIFWTPCIVHNLNLILEEIEAKTEWIKELTGQAREIIKFITNHHQSQAMYREYSKLELLKVVETRYASNFIMLRRLVEVKSALMSMVVGVTWAEWRQSDSERGSMVRRVLIDEDWWSKVEFLLKFTSPAFELLRAADTDRPFLGEIYDGMDTMVEKTVEIITQEAPTLFFVEVDFVEHVRSIIVTRWNGFNTPLHTLAHALNPKFYDEDFIALSNGKRKAPHKDKEVATGVKKAFQRLFPSSQQTDVREEFACFAAGLEDFADMSALEERSTMDPIKWWTCHGANGVYLQSLATRILSQVASSSSAERNWSTYGFIHSVKRNRLGSQKAEDLVYVHSNLRLVSRKGEEYTSGPHKEWDVDAENPDLELSLSALDIDDDASGSGIQVASSSHRGSSSAEHASCSIFDDEDEDQYDY